MLVRSNLMVYLSVSDCYGSSTSDASACFESTLLPAGPSLYLSISLPLPVYSITNLNDVHSDCQPCRRAVSGHGLNTHMPYTHTESISPGLYCVCFCIFLSSRSLMAGYVCNCLSVCLSLKSSLLWRAGVTREAYEETFKKQLPDGHRGVGCYEHECGLNQLRIKDPSGQVCREIEGKRDSDND